MFTSFTLSPTTVNLMGGASSMEPPAGSIAHLSEPFELPGIGKSVTQFKKFPSGSWGSWPGNEWQASNIANLVSWGAKIERIDTPQGATKDIPVDPGEPVETTSEPEPEPGSDETYLSVDAGEVPEAAPRKKGPPPAPWKWAVGIGGTVVAVLVGFALAKAAQPRKPRKKK